jgi:uncharacterized membrane protein HdeD (DUF308 family)
MDSFIEEEVRLSVKNWWVSLILGILFIVTAFVMMWRPVGAYEALVVLFSVCMFASGILEIFFSATNRHLPSWGWYLAGGIIDLVLGVILMFFPVVTAVMIPFLLAIWIMFKGFTAIGYAMDMNRLHRRNWGWYLAFGILGIICSLFIIWEPATGALATVYITAFAFLFLGMFRLMLSFELRNLHKRSR